MESNFYLKAYIHILDLNLVIADLADDDSTKKLVQFDKIIVVSNSTGLTDLTGLTGNSY